MPQNLRGHRFKYSDLTLNAHNLELKILMEKVRISFSISNHLSFKQAFMVRCTCCVHSAFPCFNSSARHACRVEGWSMEVRREATREGNLEATGEAPREANCLNHHLDDCVLVTMNVIYHVYIDKYIYICIIIYYI